MNVNNVDKKLAEPLIIDGFTFNTPLDAAYHIIWLLQRLSYEDGRPADGFRFRQGILAGRALLDKIQYEVGAGRN